MAPQQTTTTTQPVMLYLHTFSPSDTDINPPIDVSLVADSQPEPKSRLIWTESPVDQPKTTKKPGRDSSSVPVSERKYFRTFVTKISLKS